jgi:hypothetical protein
MHSRHRFLRGLLLAGLVMLTAGPAVAADVTPERLANPEPGNWLMNHRTYDARRSTRTAPPSWPRTISGSVSPPATPPTA